MLRTIRRPMVLIVALAVLPATSRSDDRTAPAATRRAIDALARAAGGPVQVRLAPGTETAAFVSAAPGSGIPVPAAAKAPAAERARAFLGMHGAALGLSATDEAVVERVSGTDEAGMEHVRLLQTVRGVPVTGTRINITLRNAAVAAVTAKTVPDAAAIDTTPAIDAGEARLAAERLVADVLGEAGAQLGVPRLEVFNRGLLEGGLSPSRLAWFVEAATPARHEYIWIDARTGDVLLHFDQQPHALNRRVYDSGSSPSIPGTLVRVEGSLPTGDTQVDDLYTYLGATHGYYLSEHGRDSFDGAGSIMAGSVRYCDAGCGCPCSNAYWFWGLTHAVFGGTFGVEDIVAHEVTHGVTQFEAGLYYWMQSGALNESYSDVFGESVDLLNPGGNDAAEVRWAIGEDTFPGIPNYGGFRNMMSPWLAGDPGNVSDLAHVVCNDGSVDAGGVHSNSGINNHAFALMVDGGTFNGFTVTGMGLSKAGKIMYRALTQYLAPTSTHADNDAAIRQSCADLIGVAGITAADCVEVGDALDAVEMAAPWPCLPVGCDATPSPYCNTVIEKSALRFKRNAVDSAKDSITWKWQKGTVTGTDFGNPVSGATPYAFCLYVDGALAMAATVDAGGTCDDKPCWSLTSGGMYKYRLRSGNPDSITGVQLLAGTGTAKIQVKGKGSGLGVPGPLPLSYGTDVTAQFGRGYSRRCWSTTYPAPAKANTSSTFSDKVP